MAKKELIHVHKAYRPRGITEARLSMSAGENDVFDILLTYVNKKDDIPENLYYELNIADFKKEFGLEYEQNAYKKIRNSVLKLSDKSIEILDDQNRFVKFCLFQTVRWNENTKKIEVELGNYIKKLLVREKYRAATFYHVKYTLPMNSQYSKRLYIMFREWMQTGIRYDLVDDLRDKLQVPKSYKYNMFKHRVLDVALKEINERTDISVSYEEKSQRMQGGMKVVALIFRVNEKVCVTDQIEQGGAQMILEFLLSGNIESITEKQAIAIYRVAQKEKLTDDQIRDRINYVIRKNNVKNLAGYLMFAMSDKFRDSKESDIEFRDFSEREQYEEWLRLTEKKVLYGLSEEEQKRIDELKNKNSGRI